MSQKRETELGRKFSHTLTFVHIFAASKQCQNDCDDEKERAHIKKYVSKKGERGRSSNNITFDGS
jgi:hypothetical protein